MTTLRIEQEIIVHPINGMQLSVGCISEEQPRRYRGKLPGIEPSDGDTIDEVLEILERKAKAYYGADVVVELVKHVDG